MDTIELFDKAYAMGEKGKLKESFALYQKAAILGEVNTFVNLGNCYADGIGTRKNIKKALYWYKKSWRADHQTDSCSNIALVYAFIGNYRRAVFWWKRAIDKRDGDAALELAKFYLSGKIRKDKKVIIALLKRVGRTPYVTEDGKEEALRILRDLRSEKK